MLLLPAKPNRRLEPRLSSLAPCGSSDPVWGAAIRDHLLIDLQNALINDVEATTATRQADLSAQRGMID